MSRRFWITAMVLGIGIVAAWVVETQLAPTRVEAWEIDGVVVEIESGGWAPNDRITDVRVNGQPLRRADDGPAGGGG